MTPSFTIRQVDSADLAPFFAYLNDHLQDNGRAGAPLFQPMPASRSFFPDDKIAAFTKGLEIAVGEPGWRRAWIATGATGIQGHIDLRARAEGSTAHRALLGMGVHRALRRQGLGHELIAAALDWAWQQGSLEWIDLEVLSANEPALRLYRATGFVQTGMVDDMFRIDGAPLAYTFMTRAIER